MSDASNARSLARRLTAGDLPIILAAAVVQGWSLYALHHSIDHLAWPATRSGTLAALYATAVFVPLTVQMLAPRIRRPLTWAIVAAFVAFYSLVGWHYGERIFDPPARDFGEAWFEPALVVGILWLLVMPFLKARLVDGSWRSRYELLFAIAWNNKLVLARNERPNCWGGIDDLAGVFVDLNGDRTDEFVLLCAGAAVLFRNEGGSWRLAESLADHPRDLADRVRAGDVRTEPSRWDDLVDSRYRVSPGTR